MKKSLIIKTFLVFPLILFADYLLMVLLGCASCMFGLGEDYFCGPFCIAGKIILVLSVIFIGYLIYPDLNGVFKIRKDAKTSKKQKNKCSAQDERL